MDRIKQMQAIKGLDEKQTREKLSEIFNKEGLYYPLYVLYKKLEKIYG